MIRSDAGKSVQPLIETSDNAFKITLPNINSAADIEERIITAHEKAVLELSNEFGFVRKDVEDALGVSQGTATRIIREMIKAKLLKSSGQGKNTRYYRF